MRLELGGYIIFENTVARWIESETGNILSVADFTAHPQEKSVANFLPMVYAQMGMLVEIIATEKVYIRRKWIDKSEIAPCLYENALSFIRIVKGA